MDQDTVNQMVLLEFYLALISKIDINNVSSQQIDVYVKRVDKCAGELYAGYLKNLEKNS